MTQAAALLSDSSQVFESQILGTIRTNEDATVFFPDGILGFPDCRSYVLIESGVAGAFWLQSLDHGALAFLVIDPFQFFEGFYVDLSEGHLLSLASEDPSDVAILAIVTLPGSRDGSATVNLQGPLALNPAKRIGRQVVIQDSPYGVRCPVELPTPGD